MRHSFSFDRAVEGHLAAARGAGGPALAGPDSKAAGSGLAAVVSLLERAAGEFERAGDATAEIGHDKLAVAVQQADAALPSAGRAVLASVMPVLSSAGLGLAALERDAEDRATAAEGARAFALLERLTRQGLPLEQALTAADGLFAALTGGGLLGTVLGAAKGLAHERLAAAKLQAKLAADPDASLADAPEAALLSPSALQRLEAERQALQAQHKAARQADLLAGLANGQGAASEAQLLRVLGPVLGAKAWQAYQHQQQGARAAAAGFAAVERTAPSIARLLQRPETAAFARRLAVALQEGSARPEVWAAAETKEKADAWIAIHTADPGEDAASKSRRANAILRFLESHVTALPEDLQPHALAALARQGAGAGTPGALAAVAAALRDGRRVDAFALAKAVEDGAVSSTPAPANGDAGVLGTPSGRQLASADSGASDGFEAAATPKVQQVGHDLPSADAPLGAWEHSPYAPGREQEIQSLLGELQAGGDLEVLFGRIDEVFADDPGFARHLKRLVEESQPALTELSPDDAFASDAERRPAQEELAEIGRRVAEGRPYSKPWADAQGDLASLERDSGLKLRPAPSPGMVAIFEPGQAHAPIELPLSIVRRLANDPGELADFARLLGKLQRGEPLDDELVKLAEKFVQHLPSDAAEVGVADPAWQDRREHDEKVAAVKGAQARLAEGADPAEVALHLAQVLLEDELDDTDLAVAALETALEFLPYYDLVDLGINSAELVEALIAGDGDRALAAGLGAALAAIGLIPGVGALAKKGLRWIGKGLGLLPSAARRSSDWLTGRQPLPPTHTAGPNTTTTPIPPSIAEEAGTFLHKLYGDAGSITNKEYLEPILNKLEKDGVISPSIKQWVLEVYSRDVLGKAHEMEIGKGLNRFAEMKGLRIVRDKSAKASAVDKGYFRPDFLLVPKEMSDDEARLIARDAIKRMDRDKAGFVEGKSPNAGLSPRQEENFGKMANAGHADLFFVYHLPHEKLTAESLTESVSDFFSPGRKLSPDQTAAILRVTEEIKRTMPQGAPAGDVFLACVFAAAQVLGVTVALDPEK